MATGVFYPSSNTTFQLDSSSNLGNTYAADGNVGEFASNNTNQLFGVEWAGFDFSSIPSGAVINSVEIETRWAVTGNSNRADGAEFWAEKSGTKNGNGASIVTEPTTLTVWETTDTGSWSESDLDNLSVVLGVQKSASVHTVEVEVDYVRVTVDYTESSSDPEGSTSVTAEASTTMAGEKEGLGTTSFEAEVSNESNGQKISSGQMTLSAAASCSATGYKVGSNDMNLEAHSETAMGGQKVGSNSTILDVDAETAMNGQKEASGQTEVETVASTEFTGSSGDIPTYSGQIDIDVRASTSMTGVKVIAAQVEISAEADVEASGHKEAYGQSALSVVAVVALEGFKEAQGNTLLGLEATTSASGQKEGRYASVVEAESAAFSEHIKIASGQTEIISIPIVRFECGNGVRFYLTQITVTMRSNQERIENIEVISDDLTEHLEAVVNMVKQVSATKGTKDSVVTITNMTESEVITV